MDRHCPPDVARRSPDAGFTVIELIVVMVIIAILGAIAAFGFVSARRSASEGELIAAVQTYREAIAAYGLDHGGRVPPLAELRSPAGPSDLVSRPPRPYLNRGHPEPMQELRLTLRGDAGVPAGVQGSIQYVVGGDPAGSAFTMILRRANGTVICATGQAPPTNARKC